MVAEGNIVNADTLKVGESCYVKMGEKHTQDKQIAMTGKHNSSLNV